MHRPPPPLIHPHREGCEALKTVYGRCELLVPIPPLPSRRAERIKGWRGEKKETRGRFFDGT